ncbi:hypothetical protein M8998_15365 [Sphingobacterium sp. lm-10]|uniref:hypothetical protein n=1 Tax=Sphingobacterium sp. lm-10 TaxID=2944904 RepID=UPI00202181C3|nr:hypothetical protein [Sphingobacterium sp. lm-10]MCL7989329.1 hypothetical protein [Sphingobacterium sp. lm-10]
MKKYYLLIVSVSLFLVSCVKDRILPSLETLYQQPGLPVLENRSIIHYWNFNDEALLRPTQTIGNASISYTAGSGIADAVSPGTTLNARRSDPAGGALRLRNPAGVLTLDLPTSNYRDIIFSFDVQRTSNGPQLNTIAYSIDGTTFTSANLTPNMNQVDLDWQTFSYNLSHIEGANNNSNFKIRIAFDIGNTGDSGNNRYDNITLDGTIIDLNFGIPELVHYWDFNTSTSSTPAVTPTMTRGGASLLYNGTWDSYNIGTLINAREDSGAGWALRLRNPAGAFTLTVPTTGYKDIKFSMAVQRTNNGAATNTVTYTIDGTNYISTGISSNSYTPENEPLYGLVTFDFSNISGIENNPNFKIRVVFSNGSTGSSGNNRFDNILVEGVRL